MIKITPKTYGYHEEIFSFDTKTEDIKSYSSLHEVIAAKTGKKDAHANFIKKSKQKLSFDDLVDLSEANKFSLSKYNKKIYSSNDIEGMSKKPSNKGGLTKKSKFLNISDYVPK